MVYGFMKVYSFEKLVVWQDSRELVSIVYRVTSTFPKNEIFGITNQMRRAAVSISSNIAEGTGSLSPKEQANYYKIAFGSLVELLNQLILSVDLKYLKKDNLDNFFRPLIDKIGIQINALRKATLNK